MKETGEPSVDSQDAVVVIPSVCQSLVAKPLFEIINDPQQEADLRRTRADYEAAVTLRRFLSGEIKAKEGMEILLLKKSQFYKRARDLSNCSAMSDFLKKKRGPVIGSSRVTPEVSAVIEEAYDEAYHGVNASVPAVLRAAQTIARSKGMRRPSKHYVSRHIKGKGIKELCRRKHGKKRASEKYDPKPGFKKHVMPLEVVQMDHTQVDILLVDRITRRPLSDRPWVTMIICAMTRVILGFYLSIRSPNLESVASCIATACLNKSQYLLSIGLSPDAYPFHGVMGMIYTDNAKEFCSSTLMLKCKQFGIEWDHRPIGKPHYGGIIERVIGTFMTTGVSFLPGATGANTVERKLLSSEKTASMDFEQFCSWFLNQVILYHGIVHSALKCTPRQCWEQYIAKNPSWYESRRMLTSEDEMVFKMTFLPSKAAVKVRAGGIEFSSRMYYAPALDRHIGGSVEVKYESIDLSRIWVFLDGAYHKIPCYRNDDDRSDSKEVYDQEVRAARAKVGAPGNGMIDDDHAFEAKKRNADIVAESKKMTKGARIRKKDSSPVLEQELRTSETTPDTKFRGKPPAILTNDLDY